MINLYDYQQELINDIKKTCKTSASICVVSPCGSGKSIIQGMIAKMTTDKGNTVLFLVHRKELVEQITETFKACEVNMDLCKIGMVQTITRNLEKEKTPAVIITDENHHCLAKSYLKIYEKFNKSIKLGFTATPIRLGGKGLHPVYDKLLIGPSVEWLINNKRLSPYQYYSIKLADTSKLHVKQGDFEKKEVSELMEKSCIYGDTIENYKKYADGKKTIVYCSSIKSSLATAEEFNKNSIKAIHLDSNTSSGDRKQAIDDFRAGKITVLCNVDLFGEGFDVPDCECVILLRPTKSLSLHVQQSMRAMRYKPDKTAVIIDHVGNCYEHCLPDQEITWTLEDQEKKKNKKKNEDEDMKIKECPECFLVIKQELKICPYCNHEFVANRNELEKIESELKLISSNDIKASLRYKPMKHYMKIKTLETMIDFQEAKNYKSGWLLHKLDERKNYLKICFEDLKRIQKTNGYKFGWVLHKATEYGVEVPEKYNTYRRYSNDRKTISG
jgi:superfamily II DNA or RNA helicase